MKGWHRYEVSHRDGPSLVFSSSSSFVKCLAFSKDLTVSNAQPMSIINLGVSLHVSVVTLLVLYSSAYKIKIHLTPSPSAAQIKYLREDGVCSFLHVFSSSVLRIIS